MRCFRRMNHRASLVELHIHYNVTRIQGCQSYRMAIEDLNTAIYRYIRSRLAVCGIRHFLIGTKLTRIRLRLKAPLVEGSPARSFRTGFVRLTEPGIPESKLNRCLVTQTLLTNTVPDSSIKLDLTLYCAEISVGSQAASSAVSHTHRL